jgi:hypothetical protein
VLLISTPPNLTLSIPGPPVPAGCHSPPIILNETPAPLPGPNVLPRGVTPRRPDPGGEAVLSPGGVALRQSLRGGGGCLNATPGRGPFRGEAGSPSVGPGRGRLLGGGALPSLGPSRAGRVSVGPGRGQFLSGGGRVSLFPGDGALPILGLSGAA